MTDDVTFQPVKKVIDEYAQSIPAFTDEEIESLFEDGEFDVFSNPPYEYLVMFVTAAGQLGRSFQSRFVPIHCRFDLEMIERSLIAEMNQPLAILSFQLVSQPNPKA